MAFSSKSASLFSIAVICVCELLLCGCDATMQQKAQENPLRQETTETLTTSQQDLPVVDWDVDWEITRKRPGYPLLDSAEHFVVLAPSIESGAYHHHPQIAFFNDKFFACWSNHPSGEDGPGQQVIGAVSNDGKSWQSLPILFAPRDEIQVSTSNGRLLTASQFIQVTDRLFAVATINDSVGYGIANTPIQGQVRSAKKTKEFFKRVRKAYGFLLREVFTDGTLGSEFWIGEQTPPPIANFPNAQGPTNLPDSVVAQIKEVMENPISQPMWDFNNPSSEISADNRLLTEPTTCETSDAKLVRYYRDLKGSQKLYVQFSNDNGKTWSVATQTNIPDAPAKSIVGSLPDKQFFLIGNQVVAKRGTRRDPLTIGLSEDGVLFRRAFAIRWRAPKLRTVSQQDESDGRGRGFQYPSAIVAQEALWVIYSVNKEAIDISRIGLEHLKSIDQGKQRN